MRSKAVSDFTQTQTPRSLYLANLARPFPEWAADSPVPSADEFSKKASEAFADRSNRLLPITDKLSTFFSGVDYFANIDRYDDSTWERLKSAADHFGVSKDLAPYAELFAAEAEKAASETPAAAGRFAIDAEYGDRVVRLLPLNDSTDVREAARGLQKMASERRIHYIQFVQASREIVKAAEEYGVTRLPMIIQSCGEDRLPDFEKAARMIESRVSAARSCPEAMSGYRETIKQASAGEITAEEAFLKIATSDTAIGLNYRLTDNSHIPLPHEIVYGGALLSEVEKSARENVLIRDHLVPLSAFKNVPADAYRFEIGGETGRRMADLVKDASDASDVSMVIGSLPRNEQIEIFRLVASRN